MNEDDTSFNGAVHLLIQSFNPIKQHLKLEEIPFDEVKEFLLQKHHVHQKEKSLTPPVIEEKEPREEEDEEKLSCVKSPTPIVFSTTSCAAFHRDQYFFRPTNEEVQTHLAGKVDRRKSEYRSNGCRSREKRTSPNKCEFFRLECREMKLATEFERSFHALLMHRSCPIECYNLVVDSLTVFFSQVTWSDRVQECVMDFLEQFVIKCSGELAETNPETTKQLVRDKRLLEIEVMCLLELFLASRRELRVEQLNIVEKLHLIQFVEGQERVKTFFGDILCHEFSRHIPGILASIAKKIRLPLGESSRILRLSSHSMHSAGENTSRKSKNRQFTGKSVHKMLRCRETTTGISNSSTTDSVTNRKETLKTKQMKELKEKLDEEDKQPAAKTKKDDDELLRRVDKKSVNIQRVIKLRKRLKPILRKLPVRTASHTSSSPVQIERSASKSQKQKPEIPKEVVTVSPSLAPARVKPLLVASESLPASSKNAAFILDDTIVTRYKAKMGSIKSKCRVNRLNGSEVFYGRGVARQGLFHKDPDAREGKSVQSTQSSGTQCRQKNRAGRTVKQESGEECIYIAHTLLNVHNSQPLSPFKASMLPVDSSEASFKLRRFIKPANRSERRKMEKFKKTKSSSSLSTSLCPALNNKNNLHNIA